MIVARVALSKRLDMRGSTALAFIQANCKQTLYSCSTFTYMHICIARICVVKLAFSVNKNASEAMYVF